MNKALNERIFQTINNLLLLLFVFICIYPFYYILINSLSESSRAVEGVYFWPKGFTISNYIQMFRLDAILHSFLISTLRTLLGTIITVFCCALFAYILTKRELYLRKTIYRFMIVTMYFNSGLIPWYITMRWLHLDNNFLLYILPSAVGAFNVILIRTFIEQLPPALEESAMVDGAGYFKIFSSIIFPLSMPVIATIAIFSAVGQWNSWTDNYFLVNDKNLQTMQLILLNYLREAESLALSFQTGTMDTTKMVGVQITPMTIRMTITMIVTTPILFVYPFLQRFFIKGIMLGAVKG